jgi:hypothetical protein
MSNVLVGHQVRAYTAAGNGWDEYPALAGSVSLMAVYKDITVQLMVERGESTPSSQILKERQILSFDWSATITNITRSNANFGDGTIYGASLGATLLTNGQTLMQVVFQEEVSGWWWTLYGGIKTDSNKRPREAGEEVIELENTGPVGSTGASLFYSSAIAGPQSSFAQATALTASSYDRVITGGYFAR